MKKAAVLLAFLLSGCIHANRLHASQQENQWGLGLDVSVQPEPTAFSENATDLNHLFALANSSIDALYGRCKTNALESWVRGQAREWNWWAFTYLEDACDEEDRLIILAEDKDAMANGTIAELAAKYENETQAAIDRVTPQILELPAPGTYADAEFQGWIQEEFMTLRAGLKVCKEYVAAYWNHTGQPFNNLNLDTGIINCKGSTRALDALEYLVQHYDWQPGVCSIPSADEIFARNMGRFNRSLDRAEQFAKPGDKKGFSSPYGYMATNLGPRIESAHREQWPLLLLFQQPELDFYVAYWENYTLQPRPTFEEGEYLIALHHSKVRSLTTEKVWDDERYWVSDAKRNQDWYDDPEGAVRPLALQAVTWPFGQLDCRSDELKMGSGDSR